MLLKDSCINFQRFILTKYQQSSGILNAQSKLLKSWKNKSTAMQKPITKLFLNDENVLKEIPLVNPAILVFFLK